MAVKTNFYKEDFEVILSQYSFGDYVDFKPYYVPHTASIIAGKVPTKVLVR